MHGIPFNSGVAGRPGRPVGSYGGLRQLMHGLRRQAVCAYARQRQRRALARLDERLLRDVGVTLEQARAESAKPFWRE